MTIRFRCPHCKKPLGVKDHLAGKKASCPLCKKGLVIPAPASPAAPSSAAPTAAPKSPAAAPKSPAPAPKAPPPAPEPEAPPENVEELALSALSEQDQANGQAEEVDPGVIDFSCEYCGEELHVPA